MAEAVAGSFIDAVIQSVIEAAKKEIKYVREYNTYVQNLRDELGNLEDARVDVERDADEAENNGENIKEAVTKWVDEAKNTTEEAEAFLEENDKSKKSCFGGIIPNLSTRFHISKKAEEIIETVKQLKDKKAQFGERISYRSAPLGRVTGRYTGRANYHVTKSRGDLLKEINKALMDSEISIVGVSGPFGVGKSVLMEQVEKQVKEKKFDYDFEDVAVIPIGQTPDLEKIQDDLAYRLGLQFKNEKSMEHKAHRLRERLEKKKRTLIIFDDLWKKLDLNKLGIPQGDKHSHIKLLLTSRRNDVLENDMNSQLNLMLEPLEEEESVELFEKIVGHHIKERSIQELLQKQLAEGCAGLPQFIVPLATKLRKLPFRSWNDNLKNLNRMDSIGIKKFIEETLGINYQVIEAEEDKALFLLCGQIGKRSIHFDDLLIYSIGMGFLKGDTIEECREGLKTILKRLESNRLLENATNDFIKINGLVSEVSLSIAKKDHHSLVLRNKKSLDICSEDELKRCKSISLPYVYGIQELPGGLICPELNMLLLYTYDCPLNIPDSFFNDMRKLKVMDLSGVVLTALPSSIELLDETHTLCLDRCRIQDLRNIGTLKHLQMLTFRGSRISKLPKEIGKLINLRLLDLSDCDELEVIEPGVLGSLVQLEELALPDTFDRWDVEGETNTSLNELKNMSRLSSLKIHIPDVNTLPHDLHFGNLKRSKIFIGGGWDCFMEYDEEGTLVLRLNSDNHKIIWEDWIQATLQRAQKISLLGWRGVEKGIIELSKGGFLELKHINLQYSPRIHYIFRPNERFVYSFMESVYLYKLINLEKICQGSFPRNSFSNLKSLRIKACHKLRNLFSISFTKDISRIEEIEVEDCKMITEIVTFDLVDESFQHEGGSTVNKLELMGLRTLKLSSLPKTFSFCAAAKGKRTTNKGDAVFLNGQRVSFPALESLTLSALPLLKKISPSRYPVKLDRLRILKVEACEKLLAAVDSQLLLQLKSMEELTIENCKSMSTVFDFEKLSTNEAAKSAVLPKPMSLKLVDLPNLETILRMNLKDISLVLNLKQLQVSGCEGLKHLFSLSMAKSLQHLSLVSIEDCKVMEKIFVDDDDTTDTIEFSSLTELRLSDMERLTMFASGSRCLSFPRLKQIVVSDCPKMSTFVLSKNEKKLSRTGTLTRTFVPSKNEKKLSRTTTTSNVGGVRDESFFNAKVILPSLEKLALSSLESLTSIWAEINLSKDSFCQLASIEIEDCEKLQTIFSLALMGRLHNLTDLKVDNCSALEVLFQCDERDLMISKLKDMSLRGLPKLEHLVMIKNSSKKSMLGFPNLTDVNLYKCHALVDLLPIATASTLSELENLEITSCPSMVEVFSAVASDEELASFEEMTFSNLRSVKLEDLESLTSFCTGHAKHAKYYFPFLKELSIIGCTKLKAFILKSSHPTPTEDESMPLFDEKVIFPNLQDLHIQGLKLNEIWHYKLPSRFLCKLKVLVVEECNELAILIPSFMMNNLQSLESLTVTKCNSLEVIYELEEHTLKGRKYAKSRSWKLKSIKLSDLPKLELICKSMSFSEHFHFHKLVSLEVKSCDHLTSIFPISMVHIMENLQELSIKSCKSMKQVIENGKVDHTGSCKKVVLSHLSSLKLYELPNLITFCAKHQIQWPSLEKLEISGCDAVEELVIDVEQPCRSLFLMEKVAFPKMESLIISNMSNLKELWHKSKEGKDLECSSDAFCTLKTMEIDNCNSLSTILSSKMIRGFQNLEELLVDSCSSLEQVFEVQGNGSGSSNNDEVVAINFPLRELRLSNLPTMKQIWTIENPQGVKLSFEKLLSVNIESCDSLKHLFPASVAKDLHQLEKVEISSCNKLEKIVSGESNSTKNYVDGSTYHKFICFQKATYLGLKTLPNLKSFLYGVEASQWPSLQKFEVYECPNVRVLSAEMWNTSNYSNNSNECNNTFDEHKNLVEKVNISSLKSIETDMASQEDGKFPYNFVNLAKITLSKIKDEEAIKKFPWKLLLQKIHFKKLKISYSSFEELFPLVYEEAHGTAEGDREEEEIVPYKSEGLTSDGKRKHALGNLKIETLQKLRLEELHQLKHVWKKDSIMADILKIVESLVMSECHSLTILFPASASFHNLTKMDISCCDGLVHLLTSSAARCLGQLTEMDISDCNNMEYIVIEDQDGNGIEEVNDGEVVQRLQWNSKKGYH